jgi:DNA-directed RNA polymerase alpha subunit
LKQEFQNINQEHEHLKELVRKKGLLDEIYPDVPFILIETLDLKPYTRNCLLRSGIETAAQALSKSTRELLNISYFGGESFRQLAEALQKRGINVARWWGEDFRKWYN